MFRQLDYTQFTPVPREDVPELSTLNLSIVKQLQLYCDFIKELRNCSRKQEFVVDYMFPQEWHSEFISHKGQKLNMLLCYALFNVVNLKAILQLLKSSDFASMLIKHYWKILDIHSDDKAKSSVKGNQEEIHEDFAELVTLLKGLLRRAQEKHLPLIQKNVSFPDLERALNIIHNKIVKRNFTYERGIYVVFIVFIVFTVTLFRYG